MANSYRNTSVSDVPEMPLQSDASKGLGSPAKATASKQRRISRACDYCHQRSIRCRPSVEDRARCQNCKDFNQPCMFQRKARRRGAPPRSALVGVGTGEGALHTAASPAQGRSTSGYHAITPLNSGESLAKQSWEAPYVTGQALIMDLVELYFEIVYPVFPLFHQPSFMRRISRAEYSMDRPLFTVTMAVCALVGSRVRDGSLTNPRWDQRTLQEVSPETFYNAAKEQLEADTVGGKLELNYIRSQAILALVEIQNGRIREMQHRLGIYHTLVAMEGLHDEANWPTDIGIVEREERRRLFWSIYTLDVYTAMVWGGVVRSREQQSNVAYPTEVDDEFITNDGITFLPSPTSAASPTLEYLNVPTDCWLSGWNFITDLYRVLEHALARFRGHHNRLQRRSLLRDIFDDQSTATEETVREKVMQLYINLPSCFKETPQMTFNVKMDRFGFQAANATASLQLVRMVLFTAGGASIADRCQIASDVVNAFASIPVSYLLAISTPLQHHLGGIGAILGSVFEEPLSEADYSRVRSILLTMAQLLENLEAIHQSSSASEKLRSQVARIDESMASQRLLVNAQAGMPLTHDVQPWPSTLGQSARTAPQFQEDGSQINRDLSFQIPPDLLDELTWNFEFGPQ